MIHSVASYQGQAINGTPILPPASRGTRTRIGHGQPLDEASVIGIDEVTLGEWTLSGSGPYQHFVVEMFKQAANSLTIPVPLSSGPCRRAEVSPVARQTAKNQAAIQLIDQWLADESGYDEEAWPILKQTIEENRLSTRKRFHD